MCMDFFGKLPNYCVSLYNELKVVWHLRNLFLFKCLCACVSIIDCHTDALWLCEIVIDASVEILYNWIEQI